MGLSSHTATLDLLDFDRFLARSGERVRMESIIDGITVITGIPALEVRDNLCVAITMQAMSSACFLKKDGNSLLDSEEKGEGIGSGEFMTLSGV